MDRRQQKTRQAIFEAFSRLLTKKKFASITVQEIIDEANVGRSTFYAHFSTKDDLLKTMCADIFRHVFSEELKQESNHDFSQSGDDFEKEITHILYHLQDSRKNLKVLFSCESGEIFLKYFKDYLYETFPRHIEGLHCQAPMEYILNITIFTFTETVRWWITGTGEYTPEQVASFYMEYIT